MVNDVRRFWDSLPREWLLSGAPFVKYRTLTDLLDRAHTDSEVVASKRAVRRHGPVKEIFANYNADGYWGGPRDIYTWWPKKDTTFWILGVLADFGLTNSAREITRACEYVFSTQLQCGGFGWAPPPTPGDCFTGILTESLSKLGCGRDKRLKRAYAWLIQRQRLDGGFWCKDTGLPGRRREREPSCAFATLCVLGALAQDRELRGSEFARRGAQFLLTCWDNRGKIRYPGHDSQIAEGWHKLQYPFTGYRILKYLDVLSQLQWTRMDKRTFEILNLLLAKQDGEGRFRPESIHRAWSAFDFGQKKVPSEWLTLIAYRIVKRLL